MKIEQPICRRYAVSKSIDADLISTTIEDEALRGAVESYEAIIDSLEMDKINMQLIIDSLRDPWRDMSEVPTDSRLFLCETKNGYGLFYFDGRQVAQIGWDGEAEPRRFMLIPGPAAKVTV